MRQVRVFVAVLAVMAMAALVLVGCGGSKVDLSYNKSPSNPVIVYYQLQALAPKYNTDAPQEIIYGDGKVIKSDGPSRYISGDMAGGDLDGVLETLQEEGYFELEDEYLGGQMPGGVTEVLEVHLEDKDYTVSVAGEKGPSNWKEIVEAATEFNIQGSKEYFPETVLLHASSVAEETEYAEVLTWPGHPDELADAEAAGAEGLKLEGSEARDAWVAIQESFEAEEGGEEAFFEAGGKVYWDVWADPVFPGLSE